MDLAQSLAVVRSLANGVDPESGEVFSAESPYQRPLVVRARYEAASALERQDRFERRKSPDALEDREPWTEDEDRKLLAAFDAGTERCRNSPPRTSAPWALSGHVSSNTGGINA
jgi:hypothetical protein